MSGTQFLIFLGLAKPKPKLQSAPRAKKAPSSRNLRLSIASFAPVPTAKPAAKKQGFSPMAPKVKMAASLVAKFAAFVSISST